MDSCLSLACREPLDDQFKDIPGALPHEAPEPLLPNYGPANDSGYLQDLVVSGGWFLGQDVGLMENFRCSFRSTLRSGT